MNRRSFFSRAVPLAAASVAVTTPPPVEAAYETIQAQCPRCGCFLDIRVADADLAQYGSYAAAHFAPRRLRCPGGGYRDCGWEGDVVTGRRL